MKTQLKNELKTAHKQQIRYQIVTKFMLAGATFTSLALAVMLMYQDLSHYRLSPPRLYISTDINPSSARDTLHVIYQFRQMPGRPDLMFDLHHSLPGGSGLSFVPGSLKVENGYFSEALVQDYGGKDFLKIEKITGDAGDLKLSIAVAIDFSARGGREFSSISDGAFIRFNGSNYFADRGGVLP
ncbi:MAG: hypothetical protein R3D00_30395 [Bacteroidia bacterium]